MRANQRFMPCESLAVRLQQSRSPGCSTSASTSQDSSRWSPGTAISAVTATCSGNCSEAVTVADGQEAGVRHRRAQYVSQRRRAAHARACCSVTALPGRRSTTRASMFHSPTPATPSHGTTCSSTSAAHRTTSARRTATPRSQPEPCRPSGQTPVAVTGQPSTDAHSPGPAPRCGTSPDEQSYNLTADSITFRAHRLRILTSNRSPFKPSSRARSRTRNPVVERSVTRCRCWGASCRSRCRARGRRRAWS